MKRIQLMLLREFLNPLARRLGTMLGTYMVTVGLSEDHATAIVQGIIAVVAVSVDLAASYLERNRNGY